MALGAAALFGFSTPIAKLLLGAGADPGLLAGLLYLGSGVGRAAAYGLRGALAHPGRGAGSAWPTCRGCSWSSCRAEWSARCC